MKNFLFIPLHLRTSLIHGGLPLRQFYLYSASDHFVTQNNIKTNLCTLHHDNAVIKGVRTLSLSGIPRQFIRISGKDYGSHWLRWFNTSTALHKETDVVAPTFPEAVTEGDIKWIKKVGDKVHNKEVICNIETDKSVIDVQSPGDGIIISRYVDVGQIVKAKEKICRIKFWPVKENKHEVKPTGGSSLLTEWMEPLGESSTAKSSPPLGLSRSEYKVKISEMKKNIAKKMKETQKKAALLTTFNEIDMSNTITFRSKVQKAYKKVFGINIGFMSTTIKAAAYALQDQPNLNACVLGSEIVYRKYIDISIALTTPKDLATSAVIRDVHLKNFAEIEKRINDLNEKAGKGELTVEDMDEGTFSISDAGVVGSLIGTPILNPTQAATLGLHAMVERPVAVKGRVAIRPMMYIALTYDHRFIDGREAVLFLQKIKTNVENPMMMITGI